MQAQQHLPPISPNSGSGSCDGDDGGDGVGVDDDDGDGADDRPQSQISTTHLRHLCGEHDVGASTAPHSKRPPSPKQSTDLKQASPTTEGLRPNLQIKRELCRSTFPLPTVP